MDDTVTPKADPFLKAAKTRMYELINSLATREQIIDALQLQDVDARDEEFWAEAFRTVRKRFLLLCMDDHGLDLATEWDALRADTLTALADRAQAYLELNEIGYSYIRQWFLNRGQFEYSQAIALRRERDEVALLCIRVLVLLEEGGAKYLTYDPQSGAPVLVTGPINAHRFLLKSASQKDPKYLLRMAEHFVALKKIFAVKEIKLLLGAISKAHG